MSGVSDEDFAQVFGSGGAARAQTGPVKARLLPLDGTSGAGRAPYIDPSAPRPWLRLSLQLATIAVAAAVGWYTAGGGTRGPGQVVSSADLAKLDARLAAVEDQARERERTLRQQQAADVAQVRQLVEGVGKDIQALHNGQRLVQAQRDETNLKLVQLAERLNKLEAAQMPTSSIAPSSPPPPAAVTKPAIAKTIAPAPVSRSRPLPPGGYVLGEVRNGAAVVHGHRGPVDVWPGSFLPGAGRVQAILRRNGQWVVTTTNGEIDAEGY